MVLHCLSIRSTFHGFAQVRYGNSSFESVCVGVIDVPGAMATANGSSGVEYVAAQPKQSKGHTWTALGRLLWHGEPTKIEATFARLKKQSWQQFFSNIFVTIMWRIYGILKLFGLVVEWTLNLLTLNHGIGSFLYRLFLFRWGK